MFFLIDPPQGRRLAANQKLSQLENFMKQQPKLDANGGGAMNNTLYYDRRGNWRKDLLERGKITRRTLRDLGNFWWNKGRFVFNELPLLNKKNTILIKI